MHKKHSKVYIETILKDIINLAGLHINTLAKEMNEIKISSDSSEEDKRQWAIYHSIHTIINDIIHPSFVYSLQAFPENQQFVQQAQEQHKLARSKKLINDQCRCYECSLSKDA